MNQMNQDYILTWLRGRAPGTTWRLNPSESSFTSEEPETHVYLLIMPTLAPVCAQKIAHQIMGSG